MLTQKELAKEKEELLKLTLGLPNKSKQTTCELDSMVEQAEAEILEVQKLRRPVIEKLVESLVHEKGSLGPAVTNETGRDSNAEDYYNNYLNVSLKKEYLFKEIIQLEEVQIAESIVSVEISLSNSGRHRIRFDDSILNLEIDVDLAELLRLNKIREYSLFGIHRAGPNSLNPYFSYCKEINKVCRQQGFTFQHNMSYNQDPFSYLDEIKRLSSVQQQDTKLTMCHHCKVLLPSDKFFVCQRKVKRTQTDTCREKLMLGDFLRKSILGHKVRLPPICGRKYCLGCINGWYGYESELKVSCPACQRICFCTRCNRFDNLEKLSSIYERIGGDINLLVNKSPSARLAEQLLENKPRLEIELGRLFEVKDQKSLMGTPRKQVQRSRIEEYNMKYKQVHLMKQMCRGVTVAEI